MKTHEEILEELFFMPENHDNYSAILNAMQQAVDQALAWVPVDAENLPQGQVLMLSKHGLVCYGFCQSKTTALGRLIFYETPSEIQIRITHYFDPAKLKTP